MEIKKSLKKKPFNLAVTLMPYIKYLRKKLNLQNDN